ncbi:MAG: acyl-CoA thioesterase II [Candidatus Dadabacteria bacterium]|nr:MAG: acyl-CoA thioesterase II [Candidatus Dadabacteria bacterium]
MAGALEELVELLDLEELEVNIFRGRSPRDARERVFGGQVAAQALVAAGRTVPFDRRPHSLHCYFLRPGDVGSPIVYFVDRIRDGRSFATRRVVAIQHGEAIFNMSASFQVAEEGLRHQMPAPAAPDPESLPTFAERARRMFGERAPLWIDRRRAIDMRWCEPANWRPAVGEPPEQRVWMRADGRLPDDPAVHRAVFVYASDYTLTETVMRPHGVHWMDGGVFSASLDHAIWFYEDARADEWWLYVQDSPAAAGARGLARGTIYSRDGRLICAVTQEVLLRVAGRRAEV